MPPPPPTPPTGPRNAPPPLQGLVVRHPLLPGLVVVSPQQLLPCEVQALAVVGRYNNSGTQRPHDALQDAVGGPHPLQERQTRVQQQLVEVGVGEQGEAGEHARYL